MQYERLLSIAYTSSVSPIGCVRLSCVTNFVFSVSQNDLVTKPQTNRTPYKSDVGMLVIYLRYRLRVQPEAVVDAQVDVMT